MEASKLIENWCEKVFDLGLTPFDVDTEIYLAKLVILETQNNIEADIINDFKDIFLFKLISKRLEVYHTYAITPVAMLALMSLCDTPGEAVMYMNLLQYRCKQKGFNTISMDEFTIALPGCLNKFQSNKAWDMQKGYNNGLKCDNMLDVMEYGQSLRMV